MYKGGEWWTTQPVRAAHPRGPIRRFGPMTAPPRRARLYPPSPPRGIDGVYIWSADGACVLNAWGEPPGAGGGCNRRVLACMGIAQVCVCPVHTNANQVHSMARHGLRTWCTGCTQACCALAQAQYTAPAPAPWRSASSSPGFSSNGLGARPVHKCTTGCRLQAHWLQQATMISVLADCPQHKATALSTGALHCFLSPFARTGNPTSFP